MDNLDTILGGEEQIVPSSGFVQAVMQRVHAQAAAPPPIPFPWKRAIPGFLLAAVVFSAAAAQFVRNYRASAFTLSWSQLGINSNSNAQVGVWLTAALATAAISWLLVRRLTSSGLM